MAYGFFVLAGDYHSSSGSFLSLPHHLVSLWALHQFLLASELTGLIHHVSVGGLTFLYNVCRWSYMKLLPFQLHRKLLERFPGRAKELRSVWDYLLMALGRMHPRLLGGLVNILAETHCNIFDRSWSLGEVPAAWKRANITPIYKNRKKKEIWETTNESTSLEYLEKLWSGFSWKLFLGTKKKKATGRSQNIPQLTQPSLTVSSLLFASSLVPQRLWKHDLPHEDLGEEGIKENLQVSLCHV